MSSKQKTLFWILLPVGVIFITVAVLLTARMFSKGKSGTQVSSTAQIEKVDQPGDESERAERIGVNNLGQPVAPADDKASAAEKKEKKSAGSEIEQTGPTAKATDTYKTAVEESPVSTQASSSPDQAEPKAKKPPIANDDNTADVVYRLQIGAYESKDNAEKAADDIRATGLPVSVITKKSGDRMLYSLQCAAFKDKEKANSYARELQGKGIKVSVYEVKKLN